MRSAEGLHPPEGFQCKATQEVLWTVRRSAVFPGDCGNGGLHAKMRKQTHQIQVFCGGNLHENCNFVILDVVQLLVTMLKCRMRTSRNIRSSLSWAMWSRSAVHLPIPPFVANRVHLASSSASMKIVTSVAGSRLAETRHGVANRQLQVVL